jgi:hypothetical protein
MACLRQQQGPRSRCYGVLLILREGQVADYTQEQVRLVWASG